ncbi:MAG TPA: deoxyribonuclease IV [bacterium]|nr:deoxyribonuclease IV [bacterium]HNS33917.1 deoxyribonuclease IV [bacterium]
MSKTKKISIGAHVSAAGDLSLAPQRAQELGAECFQFFSRPPQGGRAKPIEAALAAEFQAKLKEFKQTACYIHAPYYINLASANSRIYHGSISVLRQELERGELLTARAMMFHPGSARELNRREAIRKVIAGLKDILNGYTGRTQLLLEISAGAGQIIGDRFEEMAEIVVRLPMVLRRKIGFCFDTAHAFASGYDLRDRRSVGRTFRQFDKILGLKNLLLIHANDSQAELGSKKDRHQHIGQGKIGLAGFKEIVALAKKHAIDLIIETPKDGQEIEDIKILKKIRDGKTS